MQHYIRKPVYYNRKAKHAGSPCNDIISELDLARIWVMENLRKLREFARRTNRYCRTAAGIVDCFLWVLLK